MINRRQLLATAPAGALLITRAAYGRAADAHGIPADRRFDARRFGARGDGKTLDTAALNIAIDAASVVGGMVYVAGGTFLAGTIILKSNVTLFVEAGAAILGSTAVADYAPQPGPDPKADANQRHLIFARDVHNVTLAGTGTIDGQGHHFWTRVTREPMPDTAAWSDASHNEWHHGERVSPMVEIVNCTDVRMEGLTITNSSGWTIRPINCTRLFIAGIHIKNPAYGPNTDGIDVTGCQDVMIADCVIDTGDDAICLKSENPYGNEPRLSRNIVVTNCVIKSETNGFKIGTATQGGFENITFSNSVIVPAGPAMNERVIAGIALECVDGGWVDGVVITGIEMQAARAPILIRRGNRSRAGLNAQSRLRGITIDGVRASGAILTSSITGLPGMPVEDVRLSDIDIETVMPGDPSWVTRPVPELPAAYPQSRMFGWLPASGFFCRHVDGLRMRDIRLTAPADEWRPTMIFDDVRDSSVSGFRTTPVKGGMPVLQYDDVVDARISDAVAPRGSKALLRLGGRSRKVTVSNADLNGGRAITGDAAGATGVTAMFNIP